jgi:hypothetical protein
MIDFAQGEKMTKVDLNLINSVLNIKASGSIDQDALDDLNLPEGKSIAQLLYEKETKEESPESAQ